LRERVEIRAALQRRQPVDDLVSPRQRLGVGLRQRVRHRLELDPGAAKTAHLQVHQRGRYGVPGGALVDRLLVRPDLERIFEFRRAKLASILGPARI
jgi:hypothetical protein